MRAPSCPTWDNDDSRRVSQDCSLHASKGGFEWNPWLNGMRERHATEPWVMKHRMEKDADFNPFGRDTHKIGKYVRRADNSPFAVSRC
jgi:hypothetical protein